MTTIGPEPWWPRLAEDGDRFPWLLTGRETGLGPDHEPLVVDVVPVARIGQAALDEAERRYRDRFDVGQDSRG